MNILEHFVRSLVEPKEEIYRVSSLSLRELRASCGWSTCEMWQANMLCLSIPYLKPNLCRKQRSELCSACFLPRGPEEKERRKKNKRNNCQEQILKKQI